MTKQILIALIAVSGVLGPHQVSRAADTNALTPPAAPSRINSVRERMQETARELNLTAEQKQKLQAILREHGEKLRALRQDASLSQEEKRAKAKAERDEITTAVKKALTPEQFEKWKAKQWPGTGTTDSPGARVQEAIKDLNLTDAQKEQLRPIYEEQVEKLLALHQDNSLSMAQKLEKLNTLRQEVAPKFKKVLDAEQYARLEKEVDRWLEQLKARMQQQ